MSNENQRNTVAVNCNTEAPINQSLASASWIADFLAARAFDRISPSVFSNGKATLRFDGTTLTAHPGTGDQAWSSDLEDADCDTSKLLIDQILKMRPFLSEAHLANEKVERKRVNDALTGIANTIKEGPNTGSGVQLRRFLWSLYNSHHLVNLWRMTSVLDAQRSPWVSETFAGALAGVLKEDDIKRALCVAGETERGDTVHLASDQIDAMYEAECAIESVLRTLPPSRSHTELKHARDCLSEAQNAIRRAKESPETGR